jgi:3-methyladenine DNA glycosylase AlkD
MPKKKPLLIKEIHAELKKHAEPEYKKAQQRFFKEGITLYGVRVGQVRKIANRFYKQIEPKTKQQVFMLCDELLASGQQETSVIAYQWARKIHTQWTEQDFKRFEKWLKTYVNNWANCDDLSTGPLGELLRMHPQLISKTHPWRRSRNRWVRRSSAVSLIVPVRAGQNLNEVLSVAEELLMDADDMVQKGYGWLLKEASNVFPEEVFRFVMTHKQTMPRTALRYAIEKLPADKKKEAMER